MRKKIFTSLMLSALLLNASAQDEQKMYVWLKNGSVTEYEITNVDSVSFRKTVNVQPEISPMQKLRDDLVTFPPSIGNSTYGQATHYTYYSTTAEKEKPVNVLLPYNYDKNKKYPVLFILHGIGGNENDMLDAGMGVQNIISDAVTNGTKEMIVVFPQMFTSKTLNGSTGFNSESTQAYDNFINDIVDDLLPWVIENFSVATGRKNTAITGFSMGGREALYIGTQRSDVFGYVGAACPAPGILPTQDMFMTHEGSIKNEADFKIKAGNPDPYILLISGGTQDYVVGNYPEQYHNILSNNKVDHVWHSIPETGHDGSSVRPHLYNYIRHLFTVE